MAEMGKTITKARRFLTEVNRSAVWLAVAALGLHACVVLLISASNSALFDGWFGAILVFTLPFIGLVPATFLHEMGHAIGALMCGWRVWIICVGPVLVRFFPHTAVHARASLGGDAGGFVLPTPRTPNLATRLRSIIVTAAGPLASVIGAAISIPIALPHLYSASWLGLGAGVLYAFGVSSLACAVLTLWPTISPLGHGNDILNIYRQLRHRSDDRRTFFVHALGVIEYGFSPGDWEKSVSREAAVSAPDTLGYSASQATAFLYALSRDDFLTARQIASAPLPVGRNVSVQNYLRAWRDACEDGDFVAADAALAACRGIDVPTVWLIQVRELALIGILAANGEVAFAKQRYQRLRMQIRADTPINNIIVALCDRATAGPIGALLGTAE